MMAFYYNYKISRMCKQDVIIIIINFVTQVDDRGVESYSVFISFAVYWKLPPFPSRWIRSDITSD